MLVNMCPVPLFLLLPVYVTASRPKCCAVFIIVWCIGPHFAPLSGGALLVSSWFCMLLNSFSGATSLYVCDGS